MAVTPPGWYPDPHQTHQLRWWDGNAWTDHYSRPPPAPQSQGPLTAPRRRGPSLGFSIIVIAIGLAGVLLGGIVAGVGFVKNLTTTDNIDVPGRARFHLDAGRYLVYERIGTETSGLGTNFSEYGSISISAESVRVIDASGGELTVRPDTGGTETITRNSEVYTGAVAFRVPSEGDYEVQILDGRPGRALVARALGDTVRRAIPWVGLAIISGLVGLTGAILLVVGSVRRSRDRHLAPNA